MNKEDLYKEIGNIDTKYIEEAENTKSTPAYKRFLTTAAAIFIAISGLSIAMNFEYVQAQLKKFFTFVPGVEIMEDQESHIKYSMDSEPITITTDSFTFTLKNIYISDNTTEIMVEIYVPFMENLEKEELFNTKGIKALLKEKGINHLFTLADAPFGSTLVPIDIQLEIDGVLFDAAFTYGGGYLSYMDAGFVVYDAQMIAQSVTDGSTIKVIYGDIEIEVPIKSISSFDSLDQIGATCVKNDISITSVHTWSDETLNIKLYSINHSGLGQIYGYSDSWYNNDTRPYVIIRGEKITLDVKGGDGSEYFFDFSNYNLSEEEKSSIDFRVPIVLILNTEEVSFDVTVDKNGNITYPETLSLKYADINILSIEIVEDYDPDWENPMLITYNYETTSEYIKLNSFSIKKINGKNVGSMACIWDLPNEYKSSCTLTFRTDHTEPEKIKSITIGAVEYTLTDEYVFQLN